MAVDTVITVAGEMSGALRAEFDDLLAVAGRVVAPVRMPAATALVDPLSEREVTVLRYLCSHLTNQEIAAALFISPSSIDLPHLSRTPEA